MKKFHFIISFLILSLNYPMHQSFAQIFKTNPELRSSYHQFDFWLGEWEVFLNGTDKMVGKSHIMTINDSTAILENYTTLNMSYKGKSLNTYNPKTNNWEQYWTDNSGMVLLLKGGIKEGKMVMKSTGDSIVNRISWEELKDGSVRQLWEFSGDNENSWKIAFDGIYKRARL